MPSINEDIARLLRIAKSSPAAKALASASDAVLRVPATSAARPAPAVPEDAVGLAVATAPRAAPPPPAVREAIFHVWTLLLAVAAAVVVAAALLGSSLLLLPTMETWRYEPPGGVGPEAHAKGRMGKLVLEKPAAIWPFGGGYGLHTGAGSAAVR